MSANGSDSGSTGPEDPQDRLEVIRQLRAILGAQATLWEEALQLIERGDGELCAAHQEYQEALARLAHLRGAGLRARAVPDISVAEIRYAYSLETAAYLTARACEEGLVAIVARRHRLGLDEQREDQEGEQQDA